MKLIKIKGIYSGLGKIVFDTTKIIEWKELSEEKPPELPFGSSIELTISFEENDFLSGRSGIVWATYDLRQSEIIQNTLVAQQISSEVKKIGFEEQEIFLVRISNEADVNDAIDFIWRSNTGLRLKPDWTYPDREINKSFELWLNGQ